MKKIKKLYSVDFLKDDVVSLIKQGVRARDIGIKLGLSYSTIYHIRNKYRNLWETEAQRKERELRNQLRKNPTDEMKAQKRMWKEYAESLKK